MSDMFDFVDDYNECEDIEDWLNDRSAELETAKTANTRIQELKSRLIDMQEEYPHIAWDEKQDYASDIDDIKSEISSLYDQILGVEACPF